MGLHRFKPPPSGRMGVFWALSGIKNAAVVEFGCMGHNLYGGSALKRAGVHEGYGAALYTTYIDETDIALGDASRLLAVIKHVVAVDRPKAVFLQPSAVPEVIGTDLSALANLMQPDFKDTPLIPVNRGSFAISGSRGICEALTAVAERLPKNAKRSDRPSFNIIGSCPDIPRYGADAGEIVRLMAGAFGSAPVCVLSAGCDVGDIEQMGSAHVNLVIRREGLPAAERLGKRFGTPFLSGRPYGVAGTTRWLREVGTALKTEPDKKFIAAEEKLTLEQIDRAYDYFEGNEWSYPEEAVLTVGGHADVVNGIVNFAVNELPMKKGVCWCDCPEHADVVFPYFSEREWIPVVRSHDKGYLMCGGEALKWAGKDLRMTVANPDAEWRIHPYDPPFVGYRGAANLVNLWINEYARTH